MKRTSVLTAPLLSLVLLACGSSPPPETASAAAPPPPPVTATPAPEATKPVEPTPEEKKKADALKELEKDRAKLKADSEAEKARWTPELKSEAKALTDKTFASGKEAIKAAAASKARKASNAERDKQRHPVETLEFFGFKPTMTVLEYGPGEGWYTELLAPAVAKKGKLLVTNGDPNGPADDRGTFYAQRVKLFLESAPELYGKVETVTVDGKAPKIEGKDGQVDLALVMRGLHGMVNSGKLDEWLAAVHASLKPNGVLGIEQHRANADAKPEESAKKGYLPEKWVIERVEAAGFKLAGKSEINANPKDTKDYPDGVWTLPPTLKLGDKDKEKYLAIGESDRMTLKFTKVTAKTDKAGPAAKPADKTGDKAAEKPGDKPAEKPAAKPAEKK